MGFVTKVTNLIYATSQHYTQYINYLKLKNHYENLKQI